MDEGSKRVYFYRNREKQEATDRMNSSEKDKTEMQGQLEIFKAQLQAMFNMPDQRNEQLEQVVQVMGEAFLALREDNEKRFESVNSVVDETKSSIVDMAEYMKKPAKITRDKSGRVSGATRD